MWTTAPPIKKAGARHQAWQQKLATGLRAAPLGLALALLLYGLVAAKFELYQNEWLWKWQLTPTLSLTTPKISIDEFDVEHALTELRVSMIELPDQEEARAVAASIGNARMISLENQQLTARVDSLELQRAIIASQQGTNLADQKASLAQIRNDLSRLQDQQDAIATQLGLLLEKYRVDRYDVGPDLQRHQSISDASEIELVTEERSSLASAGDNAFTTASADARSWVSNTGPPAKPPLRSAASQIARTLHHIRREALLSGRERTLTIDVESGILEEASGSKFMQLDSALELRLHTATSEVINERSGRIRFFPDGSSTGGRIQLEHDSNTATIDVDWSTGVVSVHANFD